MRSMNTSFLRCIPAASLSALLMITTGCGGSAGDFPVASTHGVIETVGGETIANGRIRLTPIPADSKAQAGKPAFGEITDGQFVLTTYGNGDGAVIGKHKVRIMEAYQPHDDEGVGKPAKHNCEVAPESQTVEIVAGDNVLELKAVPKKRKRR